MNQSERIEAVPKIKDMAERYWAVACHNLLTRIETNGQEDCESNHLALQYQKGIKQFFKIKVTVDGGVITLNN